MIPLVAPSYDESDVAAVRDDAQPALHHPDEVLASFVADVAAVSGGSGGVPCASGSTALVAALRALNVGAGDVVATASYTCLAVLEAIRSVGATARLLDNVADVARMDHNLDVRTAAEVLAGTDPVAAIVVPFAFGTLVDTDPLRSLGVPLIADAAMCLGATMDGRMPSDLGDIVTFSFHESKMISTGSGGMALARDEALVERLRWACGMQDQLVSQRRSSPADVVGSDAARAAAPMSALAATLGRSQLARLAEFVARRRHIAERYATELHDLPVQLPTDIAPGAVVYRHVLRLDAGIDPVPTIAAFADRGIEVGRGVFPALHHYTGAAGWDASVAESSTRHHLSLPVHPGLTDPEVDRVVTVAHEVLGAGR